MASEMKRFPPSLDAIWSRYKHAACNDDDINMAYAFGQMVDEVTALIAAERARVVAIVQGLLDAVPKKYENGKLNHDWRSYDEGAADALDEALQALTAAPRGTTTEEG